MGMNAISATVCRVSSCNAMPKIPKTAAIASSMNIAIVCFIYVCVLMLKEAYFLIPAGCKAQSVLPGSSLPLPIARGVNLRKTLISSGKHL